LTAVISQVPTPYATTTVLKITDMLVYPNPYTQSSSGAFMINYTATRDFVKVRLLIYTSGIRLVKEAVYTGSFKAGKNRLNMPHEFISNFASGTYFYVIFVTDTTGKEIKSSIGKAIIFK
jgi:hypothetical protein